MTTRWPLVFGAIAAAFLGGCTTQQSRPTSSPQPQQQQQSEAPHTAPLDAQQAERLQRIMLPLVQHMDHPMPLNQVKMTVIVDQHINAANGGGGDFYVTTGLLRRASDDELRAVMAHEVAHADLGHVAKAQALATGLDIGIQLLEQVVPGSSNLTPIAGNLVFNAYSRSEESQADAHGVAILRRGGFDGKTMMVNALTWLENSEGNTGGFFQNHPLTSDRIDAVRRLH
ncbi:MAG: M48 family metallopeptidase [Alphaproteobacteria bacterium]